MKLILNAPAVRALVERDPEGTLEMAKAAAEQVAEEMARKVTKERFEHAFNSMMTNMISQSAWKPTLQPNVAKMLSDYLADRAGQFVDSVARGPIQSAIRQEAAIAARIAVEAELTKIDAVIEERANKIIDRLIASKLLENLLENLGR